MIFIYWHSIGAQAGAMRSRQLRQVALLDHVDTMKLMTGDMECEATYRAPKARRVNRRDARFESTRSGIVILIEAGSGAALSTARPIYVAGAIDESKPRRGR